MSDNESINEQLVKELEQLHEEDLVSVRWHILWLKMTPAERQEMTILMLERIYSRQAAITAQEQGRG